MVLFCASPPSSTPRAITLLKKFHSTGYPSPLPFAQQLFCREKTYDLSPLDWLLLLKSPTGSTALYECISSFIPKDNPRSIPRITSSLSTVNILPWGAINSKCRKMPRKDEKFHLSLILVPRGHVDVWPGCSQI